MGALLPGRREPYGRVARREVRNALSLPATAGIDRHRSVRKGSNRHMKQLRDILAKVQRTADGQGLAEYALILALIAIVAIVALIFLGGQVSTILSTVGQSV